MRRSLVLLRQVRGEEVDVPQRDVLHRVPHAAARLSVHHLLPCAGER